MIKVIEFPDQEFASKEDLFKALHAHQSKIIQLKKAQIFKSADKGQLSYLNAEKAMQTIEAKGFRASNDSIYPIISTTRYMDSHKDVHFDGCFKHTAKDQQGRVMYTLDHKVEWDSVIAWPKNVRMFIANVDWAMVGKSYTGQTQALVFEIKKLDIKRRDVLEAIERGDSDFENSIRMVYHKITLGLNSDDPEHKDCKDYYDSRISQISNKELAESEGHFWGVEELGIHKEGSLVVAGGSNDATAIYHKNIVAADRTTTTEPRKSTHKLYTKYL